MSETFGLYTIIVLGVLLFHQICSYLLERANFHYLHESGLAMIIGGLSGAVVFSIKGYQNLSFSKDFFFFVLVPILFYAEAYNMQKRFFFKYILYIFGFGVFGTFLNVNIILGCTYVLNYYGWIVSNGDTIILTGGQMTAFAIIMASLECVVGKTTVNQALRPKLHSVLFGEELMNEVTVYSLFVSYLTLEAYYGEQPMTITWYFKFVWTAIYQFLLSLVGGLIMGAMFTILAKYLVHMLKTVVAVTTYVLYVGYLCYSISKLFHQPGAVTIFVVGITFSHYLCYNVPYRCFEASRNSLRTLASCSETFIFVYLGLSFSSLFFTDTMPNLEIAWGFLLVEIMVIFFSRIFCFTIIVGFIFLLRLKNRQNFRISFYELVVLCCSGLVRGSVGFALVQYVTGEFDSLPILEQEKDQELLRQFLVIKSGVLFLIICSNLLFGLLMPFIAKVCFDKIKNTEDDEESKMIRRQTMTNIFGGEYKEEKKFKKLKIDTKAAKIKIFFKNIDENYLKPLMIYDYKNRKQELRWRKRRMDTDQKGKNAQGAHGHGHAPLKRSNSDEIVVKQKNAAKVAENKHHHLDSETSNTSLDHDLGPQHDTIHDHGHNLDIDRTYTDPTDRPQDVTMELQQIEIHDSLFNK